MSGSKGGENINDVWTALGGARPRANLKMPRDYKEGQTGGAVGKKRVKTRMSR